MEPQLFHLVQVEATKAGFFTMDVQREQEHKCSAETCSVFNILAKSRQPEAWVVLLAENVESESATAPELIAKMFADEWLAEGLRCEKCGNKKQVLQHSVQLTSPEVLAIQFPRNSHFDHKMLRQQRNQHPIHCPRSMELNGCWYAFVALVEHLPSSPGDVDTGHFVAWLQQGQQWLRCDDAIVTRHKRVAETVERGVVLALYERSGAEVFLGCPMHAEPEAQQAEDSKDLAESCSDAKPSSASAGGRQGMRWGLCASLRPGRAGVTDFAFW